MKNIKKLKQQSEDFYSKMNEWLSNEGAVTKIIDLAYPNHDGEADAEAMSELMLLRQSLYSLSQACGICMEHLNEVIELDHQQ